MIFAAWRDFGHGTHCAHPMSVPASATAGRSHPMSERAHFWLRIVGLALILATQFGPRLIAGGSGASARVTAAAIARQ